MLRYVVPAYIKLNYFKALRSGFLLIFLANLAYKLLDQYITVQIDGLVKSTDGVGTTIWFWAAFSVLIGLLFPIIITLACSYSLAFMTSRGFGTFFSQKFELTLLETLRSWGKVFLWTLVFVIPGLIKAINYLFVSFVVAFSQGYERGEVDALNKSSEIAKHVWWKLLFYFAVFFVLLPLLITGAFDEYTSLQAHPITGLIFVAIDSALYLLYSYFILNLFFKNSDCIPINTYQSLKPTGDAHVTHV